MKTLARLAALFRYLQLFAHGAHNFTKGPTFFEDHEYFGGAYGEYEALYDGIIERMIGLGGSPNIVDITTQACSQFTSAWSQAVNTDAMYRKLIDGEQKIRDLVETLVKQGDWSQGTINMLADISDKSEMRSYKLGQRVA